MINSDFKAVETVILERIARIRKEYEKTHHHESPDEVQINFDESISGLKLTLKTLRESYYKDK